MTKMNGIKINGLKHFSNKIRGSAVDIVSASWEIVCKV
jgi:hypothetical protein